MSKWMLFIQHTGREISDDNWQVIEPAYINTIRDLIPLYVGYNLRLAEGEIKIDVDLGAYRADLENFVSVMSSFVLSHDQGALRNFNHDGVQVVIEATVERDELKSLRESAVMFVVFELFLVLNLSDPGIFNLYGSRVSPDPPEYGYRGQEYRRNVSLHGRLFEVALYEKEGSPWLLPKRLDGAKVACWIRRICRPDNLLPKDPSAKALYALLRIAKSDMDASALIWVFYALESLFQCRSGENFSALNRRISNFLGLSAEDASNLKRRLRKIYDLRSSLVHGGASIAHPIEDDALDKRAFESSWEFQKAVDFGSAIVVICLQKLIIADVIGLQFEEAIGYVNFSETPLS
jgi:hypothetical protein